MEHKKDFEKIDALRHVEVLVEKINETVGKNGKSVFAKYPITFGLLTLFGVIILSEGVKDILKDTGLLESNPWIIFLTGLSILILTGTLYKKLNK